MRKRETRGMKSGGRGNAWTKGREEEEIKEEIRKKIHNNGWRKRDRGRLKEET